MKRQPQAWALEGFPVRIRIQGQLDAGWSEWFDGLAIEALQNGETTLSGAVTDQASLHGLLARIRDLGLPLLGLEVGEETLAPEPAVRETRATGARRHGIDAHDPGVPVRLKETKK